MKREMREGVCSKSISCLELVLFCSVAPDDVSFSPKAGESDRRTPVLPKSTDIFLLFHCTLSMFHQRNEI